MKHKMSILLLVSLLYHLSLKLLMIDILKTFKIIPDLFLFILNIDQKIQIISIYRICMNAQCFLSNYHILLQSSL